MAGSNSSRLTTLLATRRPVIFDHFKHLRQEATPDALGSIEEAWQAGLRRGFNQGLVLGVALGLEIGMSLVEMPDFDFADTV
jgi:hypothetical protein